MDGTNRGSKVALSAPATGIPALTRTVTRWFNNYPDETQPSQTYANGTPYAAAQVAATLAMMMRVRPELSISDLKERLTLSTRRHPNGEQDMGEGVLDAVGAMRSALARIWEKEPNDWPDQANQIDWSANVKGALIQHPSLIPLREDWTRSCVAFCTSVALGDRLINDEDFFKVFVPPGQLLLVSVEAACGASSDHTCYFTLEPEGERTSFHGQGETASYRNLTGTTKKVLIDVVQHSTAPVPPIPYVVRAQWRPVPN
jgi:hypothetical protein